MKIKKPFIVDNYIVRIYRRDEEDIRKVAGIIEQVGAEEKQAFHNMDELCGILSLGRSELSNKRSGSTKGK